ncbi:MAG: MoaD/ThiS family protein [Candidatus Thermoplasmatota archaeon]|nr:MoaD/ThiS family protein [Candidatus Thermoplasmatota archaeon]
MKVKIKFFSLLQKIAGKKNDEIEIADCSTVEDLEKILFEKYPELKKYKPLLSVNNALAKGAQILKDGDEVALYLAVAGG